ncbi:MAG: ROK family protein, partial [Candidatus Nanohalobium sp.]
MVFLCVDIGATNTLIGLGNDEFEVLDRQKTKTFLKGIEAELLQTLEKSSHTKKEVEKIAVAAAGPIDRESEFFHPPNVSEESGMEEIDLGSPLRKLGELTIMNDCAAAAIGEHRYGKNPKEDMVYITISSGIGAGVIMNGELVEGWKGNFAEIGHINTGSEGLKCGCGARDHWEAYSSGNNLPKMAEKLFDAEFSDAKQVFEEAEKGDRKAEKTIRKMQEINARGVADTVNVYNPQKIVLGGALPLNHAQTVVEPLKQDI